MCLFDVCKTLCCCLCQLPFTDGTFVLTLCVRMLVVSIKTRCSGEIKSHACGILNVDSVLIYAHCSVLRLCLHIGLITHAVSFRRTSFVHSVPSVRTLVIAWVQTTRCCTSHHEDIVPLCLYIGFELRSKTHIEIELVRLVCRVVDGNHVVGIRSDEFTLIVHAFEVETRCCHCFGNAQVAHIIIDTSPLFLVLESLVNLQVAQWQITFAIHALHLLAEFVCLGIFLLYQRLAHLSQILKRFGIHTFGNGFARPQRTFV